MATYTSAKEKEIYYLLTLCQFNRKMNIYLRHPNPSQLSLARLLMGISHPIRPYLPPFSPIYRSARQTRKPQTLITKRPISGCGSAIGKVLDSTAC